MSDIDPTVPGGDAPPAPPSPPPAPPTPGAGAAPPPTPPGDAPPDRSHRHSISQDELTSRLDRHGRSLLKKLFGTDDPEEAKKLVTTWQQSQTELEQAKRSQMSKEQQLETDLNASRTTAETYQQKYNSLKARTVARNTGHALAKLAGKHVDPQFVDFAVDRFKSVVRKMDPKVAERAKPKAVAKWFSKFAEKHPAMKRGAGAAPPAPPPAPPVVQVPGSVGPRKAASPPPVDPNNNLPANLQGKTPRPGMPNSMNKQELQQYYKSLGITGVRSEHSRSG